MSDTSFIRQCLLVIASLSCCLSSVFAIGSRDTIPFRLQGFAQGTTYNITYYAVDSVISASAIDSIIAVIDSSMSAYKPYSTISKFNSGEADEIILDEHFTRVIRKSFEIHEASDGIFDVTVAPLVRLWGFGPQGTTVLPDSQQVRACLSVVGMDKLQLCGSVLSRTVAGVSLDVNGIAQGYTVDVLAEFLEGQGVTIYNVELGGELRLKGPKPDGSLFRIGIERPIADMAVDEGFQNVIELSSGAITTAGSYRRFIRDGARFISHHIDPLSGYPYDTGIISATIVARDAMTADGYDNVIMGMFPDAAIAFAESMPGIEVYIVYREDDLVKESMTKGFTKLLSKGEGITN